MQRSTASWLPLHQANKQLLYADCSDKTLGIYKIPALSVLLAQTDRDDQAAL